VEAPPTKDDSPADLPDQFPEGLAESWAWSSLIICCNCTVSDALLGIWCN
jgi:hypothetical protein